MSFLRHARSMGPMGHVKIILRLRLCAASHWSATGSAVRRGCYPAPSLIVRDEYAPAIPWRVALQQSPPPLHRMFHFAMKEYGRSRNFHRTANCRLTGCLSRGVHPISRLGRVKVADYRNLRSCIEIPAICARSVFALHEAGYQLGVDNLRASGYRMQEAGYRHIGANL